MRLIRFALHDSLTDTSYASCIVRAIDRIPIEWVVPGTWYKASGMNRMRRMSVLGEVWVGPLHPANVPLADLSAYKVISDCGYFRDRLFNHT